MYWSYFISLLVNDELKVCVGGNALIISKTWQVRLQTAHTY